MVVRHMWVQATRNWRCMTCGCQRSCVQSGPRRSSARGSAWKRSGFSKRLHVPCGLPCSLPRMISCSSVDSKIVLSVAAQTTKQSSSPPMLR
uniref:Uncharacterized protein n=1 Tax=Hyaloperonospora arabidopsidis (strain Emoy2) TaxID=559515 RepID=M4BHE0_HYAAE